MKKTRSEMKREIKNSQGAGDVSSDEDKTTSKRKKSQANSKSKTEPKLTSNNNIEKKTDKLLESYSKLYEELKKKMEKYEDKPVVSDKEFDSTGARFSKILTISKFKIVSQLELYYKQKYEEHHKSGNSEDICSICQYPFFENLKTKSLESILEEDKKEENHVVLLENCSDHYFHSECLEMMIGDKTSLKCPNCNKIYGIMTGDQPPGTMDVQVLKKYKCDGFNCDTIQMDFNFPDGSNYTGTSRVGYLPNNKEGREILAMFKVAFDRKLLFTIGTSVTTGKANTTIWNGIHFKTNMDGGAAYFGYPDPTYFNRVKQELAAKGVIEENIKEDLNDIADGLLKSRANSNKRKKK